MWGRLLRPNSAAKEKNDYRTQEYSDANEDAMVVRWMGQGAASLLLVTPTSVRWMGQNAASLLASTISLSSILANSGNTHCRSRLSISVAVLAVHWCRIVVASTGICSV